MSLSEKQQEKYAKKIKSKAVQVPERIGGVRDCQANCVSSLTGRQKRRIYTENLTLWCHRIVDISKCLPKKNRLIKVPTTAS